MDFTLLTFFFSPKHCKNTKIHSSTIVDCCLHCLGAKRVSEESNFRTKYPHLCVCLGIIIGTNTDIINSAKRNNVLVQLTRITRRRIQNINITSFFWKRTITRLCNFKDRFTGWRTQNINITIFRDRTIMRVCNFKRQLLPLENVLMVSIHIFECLHSETIPTLNCQTLQINETTKL